MARTISNIKSALNKLGYKGKARVEYIDTDRVVISLNGEYLGLWDTEKNTFVD